MGHMSVAESGTEYANAFRVLGRLRSLRAFQRRHLHCLRTIEDLDLVCEIGHYQGQRRPLTLKQVYLLGIGTVPTIQRRLRHLRRAGCVQQRRGEGDRRTMELTLAPRLLQVFSRSV
jgi:hypothetical protein